MVTDFFTATYSPDDNKLRLYAATRLDSETYKRVKGAGFAFAPKQDLFVAPAWTPEREDLLLDLCGEIDDEGTSLSDRATTRAARFADYQERRAAEAEAAHRSVAAITDGIPMGQPILVGHHSERRARRDAERIQSGMARAVKLWETSEYWTRRAAASLRHVEHKEDPAVRHRRIKGLEADKRKHERAVAESSRFVAAWSRDGLTREQALRIANFDHVSLPPEDGKPYRRSLWSALESDDIDATAAARVAREAHAQILARARRWIAHLTHRLEFERALLGDGGRVASERFPFSVGGRVLVGREWLVVLRVNSVAGSVTSLTTNASFARVKGVELVRDYRPPEDADLRRVQEAQKLPPLTNYPGDGFQRMTRAEWASKPSDYKSIRVCAPGPRYGAHRYRTAFVPGGSFATAPVFITDAKVVDPPGAPRDGGDAPLAFERQVEPRASTLARQSAREPSVVETLRAQLKAGVHVVQAEELFPTPPELAARVVDAADIQPGQVVLEPSAGTGALVREIERRGARVVTVEIHPRLAELTGARCADFIGCRDLGTFDRIVMNPPFSAGQDVTHVLHALSMLASGGKLVAVMSAGVTFRNDARTSAFRELVESRGTIEALPEGAFAPSGTKVRTALVTIAG